MDILRLFTTALVQEKHLTRHTVRNYLADIRQFIRWYEHSSSHPFAASRITLHDIERYKTATTLSPTSLARHMSSLRKFFTLLLLHGVIAQNPFALMTIKEPKQADPWNVKGFAEYLYVFNASPLTIKYYTNDVKCFLSWLSEENTERDGHTLMQRNIPSPITSSSLRDYHRYLKDHCRNSQATINRKRAAISKYLRWREV